MSTITLAKPHNLAEIKDFYSHCGYGGGLRPEDRIWMAHSKSQLVGVVRICPEHDVLVLRGMQVLKPFQRQGIGRKLLQACTQYLGDGLCYCIPWTHLQSFYQQGGFEEAEPTAVPDFLQKRLAGYLDRGMKVMIMQRLPTTISASRKMM